MPSEPYPYPQSSRSLTAIAWGVTILVSTLPDIVSVQLTGSIPAWSTYAKMGLLLVLALAAFVWKPLRPLRNFLIALLVFFGLFELRLRIDFSLPALQKLFGGSVFDVRMQAEQTGKLAVALAMIATLFILGYKRRDFFLARGDLRTPIEPVPLLGFPKPDPWPQFGLQWGFYIAAAVGSHAIFWTASGQRCSAQSSADFTVHPVLCRIECFQRRNHLPGAAAGDPRAG